MEEIVNLDKLPKGDRCKIVTTNIHKIRAKREMDKFLNKIITKNGTTKY
tara:strand:+ start:517 stop:663 length:147 start_codon:yes stop_codon:yes gene_type:complete